MKNAAVKVLSLIKHNKYKTNKIYTLPSEYLNIFDRFNAVAFNITNNDLKASTSPFLFCNCLHKQPGIENKKRVSFSKQSSFSRYCSIGIIGHA